MAREWRGVSSRYRFRCEIGHVSSQSGASLGRLIRGARGPLVCHQCWVERTLTRIHETTGSAGGQCLSKRYRGKNARHRFVCAAGHKLEATAASVLADHWCAKCSTERRAERRRYQAGLKPIQDRVVASACRPSTMAGWRNIDSDALRGTNGRLRATTSCVRRGAKNALQIVSGCRTDLRSYKRRRQSMVADVLHPCINVFRLVTHFSANGGTSGWHGVRKS